jgi:4,5-DOPA dioxygenase extradiol
MTNGTRVTGMAKPRTIHDFGGFPQALFDVQYPAPGAPDVALETQQAFPAGHVLLDDEWGFDHGTWSVLNKMYPKANIPVLQLSLDYNATPQEHYAMAKSLAALRNKGVLILGSGNVVHNLRAMSFTGEKFDWAVEFDAWVTKHIEEGTESGLADFQKLGSLAKSAHPTYEHYLPLLYATALREKGDGFRFFNEGIDLGSISMRSVIYQ